MEALKFDILRMVALMIENYSFCESFEKEGFDPDVARLKVQVENEQLNHKAKLALKRIYNVHILNGFDEDIKKYNEVEPIEINKIPTADSIIEGIDFKQLKEQKIALLNIMPKGENTLDGLIGLIDAIQDYAVEVLGKDELEVFHLTNVGSITHGGIDYPTRTMTVVIGEMEQTITISTQSLITALDLDKVEDENLDNSIYFYVEDDKIELSAEDICANHLDETIELVEEGL